MKKKSLLILLNGKKPPLKLLRSQIALYDEFVCADGAANFILKKKIIPDYIMGDFDSLQKEYLTLYQEKLIQLGDQNYTDAEKIIYRYIEKQYKKIKLLGALGKRIDHTLYHFHLLKKFYQYSIDIEIETQSVNVFYFENECKLLNQNNTCFSLFSLSDCTKIISSSGTQYPLDDISLKFGIQQSISNKIIRDPFFIKIESGGLFIILHK